ncbi:MAG: CocE/NonD family hydrolase [Caldilineaceae bacterium]
MITQALMSPLRDGISLQSAFFLSESEGPFPSLMVRCMYGVDQRIRRRAESFVAAGYAVVAQNVRGRHQSEGGQISFADFPEDGFDTFADY